MADSLTADPVVRTAGLTKRFGDVAALDNLDLEVPRNSLFGFLGPNGAGKTTLMRLLLGLTRPTEGEASVFGMDVVKDSVEIRKRIGYLPQHPAFYNDLNPRETLRYARGFFPMDRNREVEDDIDEVLELVGLEGKGDRAVGNLSGGERQRLGIAQAQIHRPELLILDEPASALDPLGRRDVLDIMRRLKESTTVFYSTHILDDVQRVSDTVAILNRGTRIAQAAISELLGGTGRTAYEIHVQGDGVGACERLRGEHWVSDVRADLDDAGATLTVEVVDEPLADQHLLRIVLENPGARVLSYGRLRSELEDVFVEMVEGTR